MKKFIFFFLTIIVISIFSAFLINDVNIHTLNQIECRRNTVEKPYCKIEKNNFFIKNTTSYSLDEIQSAYILTTNTRCSSGGTRSYVETKCHYLTLKTTKKPLYLDLVGEETSHYHNVPDLDKKVSEINNFLNDKSISHVQVSIDRTDFFKPGLIYFIAFIICSFFICSIYPQKNDESIKITKDSYINNKFNNIVEVFIKKQSNGLFKFVTYYNVFLILSPISLIYLKPILPALQIEHIKTLLSLLITIAFIVSLANIQYYYKFEIDTLKKQLVFFKDRFINPFHLIDVIKYKGYRANSIEIYNFQDVIDIKFFCVKSTQNDQLYYYFAIDLSNNNVIFFELEKENKCIQDENYRVEFLKEIYANLNLEKTPNADIVSLAHFPKEKSEGCGMFILKFLAMFTVLSLIIITINFLL